ncbi:hypothetical protein JF544_18820 [Halobacillus kuroshimensis]|uniref:Uncharacterized protein n=1 Tax=Halobacillus kuroshimensis TaxID=302481 RepID=A0ABS3E135_9BACI|nr:hypothetical protein [Halobacillus kuroshimensis]MBN8237301.1 hypothetical protein [Halobacillus kuroshimensis]
MLQKKLPYPKICEIDFYLIQKYQKPFFRKFNVHVSFYRTPWFLLVEYREKWRGVGVRRKQEGKVNNKVFRMKDVERIANFFVEMRDEINKKLAFSKATNKDTEINFRIEFSDGSSIRDDNVKVFQDIETKLVDSMYFDLKNYANATFIELTLNSNIGYGDFTVESDKKDTVDAKFRQLEEIIGAVKDQNHWLTDYKKQAIINNITGIFLSGSLFYLFFLLFENPLKSEVPILFLLLLLCVSLGHLIAYHSLKKLYDLYPKIEFDIAEEHINLVKKRRKRLYLITTLFIIPLVVAIFFDIFKSFFL